MIRAVYSGRSDAWNLMDGEPEICIAPRRMMKEYSGVCPLVAVEDLSKTPTWLWLNEAIQEQTALLYVRVSSYKFDSDKARRLERLAMISRNVFLLDVTPFCAGIETLYDTWRYIDRSILGYQHHYACAGAHYEVFDGGIVPSLDLRLNAHKIAPHCQLESSPVRPNRTAQTVAPTDKEAALYASRREEMFARHKTPQPIVTRLADTVHAFESRRNHVMDISTDKDIVIVNIDSHAKWYRDNGRDVMTYSKPRGASSYARAVFAEAPIVYPHRKIHIEADLAHDCEVIDVHGDCKVDAYLWGRIDTAMQEIDLFCNELRSEHARLSN